MKDMTYQYVIVLFQPPMLPLCGTEGGYHGTNFMAETRLRRTFLECFAANAYGNLIVKRTFAQTAAQRWTRRIHNAIHSPGYGRV